MEDILTQAENRGIAIGEKRGEERGEKRGEERGELKGMIRVYYNDLELTPDEIFKRMNQPLDTVLKIIKSLKK